MDLARPNTTSVAARVILRTGDWGSENAFIAEDLRVEGSRQLLVQI
jgi:hypothetical protein